MNSTTTKSTKHRDKSSTIEDNQSPKKEHKKKNISTDKKNLIDKNKKKVAWNNPMINTVNVASYKKYNLDNCHEDPVIGNSEKVKCSCNIF